MSSQQLNALGPEELKQHAEQVVSEARHAVARAEAEVAVAAAAVEATPMDAREDIKAAVAALLAAKETEVAARAAMARAMKAIYQLQLPPQVGTIRFQVYADGRPVVRSLFGTTIPLPSRMLFHPENKNKAIANLNILHRQQMMGDWSDDINEAYIQDRIYETRPDVIKAKKDKEAQMIKAKKETKEHMGSMLGDWDKAGKIIKRHTSKNRKKTKRRKQKIAKRIKGTKRR